MMLRKRPPISEMEEPLVNLTPLIDVVFVVLIIFILIAPMLDVDIIKLAHSSPTEEQSLPSLQESPIVLHVHADNTIWLHKQRIAIQDLYNIMTQERHSHPEAIPQLFHDERASFGTYQAIKNAVEQAGFSELDVMLDPS